MKKKKSTIDIIVIGFALFSMLFGAGNLIFPPYLGLEAGPHWLQGLLCYYLADLGLALLTLFAILKRGSSNGITDGIGNIPSTILMCIIVLSIGPLVAIPRTAATTYELSIVPVFQHNSSTIFSILFFALILSLCLNESAVVDIVGKILTPLLLLGLFALIFKGLLSPLGSISRESLVSNVTERGVKAGYQTLDVLAIMLFGVIILKSAKERGYLENKEKKRVIALAGILAGLGLFVTYMGLTYLGATVSSYYDLSITRSTLILSIVRSLLGQTGVIIFAIIVALACITTALALVSSTASYFSDLLHHKISYKLLVVIICFISALFSNIGLDVIVAFTSPLLDVLYPPILVMVLFTLLGKGEENHLIQKTAVAGALLSSIFITINEHGANLTYLSFIPLYSVGFGWVLPAVFSGIIGWSVKAILEH